MELGGSQDPVSEAQSYRTLPFGAEFKQLMRSSILRDRLAGGRAGVARVTWSAGKREQVAQQFWIPGPPPSRALRLAEPSA